jgi:hypothetical protein
MIEPVKWVAVVAMLLDHLNRYALHHHFPLR